MEAFVMGDPIFLRENIKRWSSHCPKGAEALTHLQCSHVLFAETDSRELILIKQQEGNFFPLYTNDPKGEAEQWFASLDLQGINVLYVYGVGLAYYYEAAKEWLRIPDHFLIFLEDDLEVIHRLFERSEERRVGKECP